MLPIALVLFMVFGAITQPLFMTIQTGCRRSTRSCRRTWPGIKVVKAFAREPHEQKRFDAAAERADGTSR